MVCALCIGVMPQTVNAATIIYELTQNNSTTMRTGTVIIYGKGYLGEFVINQKPKENPTISIAPWEDGGTIELYL